MPGDMIRSTCGSLPASVEGKPYSSPLLPSSASVPYRPASAAGSGVVSTVRVPDDVTILPRRIGDAERDAAAMRIGEAFARGVIDRAEMDARAAHAAAARTFPELEVLLSDLPGLDEKNVRLTEKKPSPFPPATRLDAVLGMAHWTALIGVMTLFFTLTATGSDRGLVALGGNVLFFGSILVMFAVGVASAVSRSRREEDKSRPVPGRYRQPWS